MNLQVSDYVLILTPAVLQAFLAAGMLRLRSHRHFPWFFSYTVFDVVSSVCLFVLVHQKYQVYFYGYWIAEAVSVLLGFAVIYEILGHVLGPYEAIWGLGRKLFIGVGALAICAAIA
ncbi:MAG: hypothetical protein ACREB3_14560, partial [Burkholderiales bacterium]